uniref:Sugar transporter SWEET1 n=1 Tax=Nothoprocta perdicaria TaxID=30464 RepID=A0A8C7E9L9_NOTPE
GPRAMAPAPLLAAACLACTLAMFGTGLSDLRQMLATQSVENIQFLPFLATDANNLGWLGYGCLKRDPTLVAVNAVGAALNTLCVLVYLRYSPHKVGPVLGRGVAVRAPYRGPHNNGSHHGHGGRHDQGTLRRSP